VSGASNGGRAPGAAPGDPAEAAADLRRAVDLWAKEPASAAGRLALVLEAGRSFKGVGKNHLGTQL
jgi:hypothetical protein